MRFKPVNKVLLKLVPIKFQMHFVISSGIYFRKVYIIQNNPNCHINNPKYHIYLKIAYVTITLLIYTTQLF